MLAHKKAKTNNNNRQQTPEPIRIIVSQTLRVGSQKSLQLFHLKHREGLP
jgi:hemin uptake protein HemP